MTLSPARFGLAACVAAAALGLLAARLPAASAAQPHSPPETAALQVMADVMLIEAECRTLGVDYGQLFAFAERNGIRPVDIMPTGERRPAFDAAYRRRAREIHGDRLCTDLAAERAGTIPGVFTAR